MNQFLRSQLLLNPGTDGGNGNEAAIMAAMDKARNEANARLQPIIDKLTADNAALTAKVTELTASLTAASASETALKDRLKAFEASSSNGNVDITKAIESAATISAQRVREEQRAEIESLQQELGQLRSENKKAAAANLRRRLIEEHGGSAALIPELVTGESEAEVLGSIALAKDAFNRAISQASGTRTQPATGNPSIPTLPPAAGGQTQQTQPKTVGRMSPAEWAAHRKTALAAVPRYADSATGL